MFTIRFMRKVYISVHCLCDAKDWDVTVGCLCYHVTNGKHKDATFEWVAFLYARWVGYIYSAILRFMEHEYVSRLCYYQVIVL